MADPAPRPLVVLHGYEDPPGRRRVVPPDDPRWHLLEPRGPVELAGGPAWFASDDDGPVEAQLMASVRLVQAVVGSADPDGDHHRVTVGGFSQGGAVALAAALSAGVDPAGAGQTDESDVHRPPGAVFCVNGWLPHAPALGYDPAALVASGTRVLVVASADDEVVPVQQGRSAARWLERAGVDAAYVEVPGGHAVGPEARAAVVAWLDESP